MGVEGGAEDVSGAAGVGQQVVDGDGGGDVRVGVVGEVVADRCGEVDLAGLHELEDGDRGDHLVHRPDAEAGLQGVRDRAVAVGQPDGVAEQHLAVSCDQHGAAEAVRCGLLAQQRFDVVEGGRGDGQLGGERGDLAGGERPVIQPDPGHRSCGVLVRCVRFVAEQPKGVVGVDHGDVPRVVEGQLPGPVDIGDDGAGGVPGEHDVGVRVCFERRAEARGDRPEIHPSVQAVQAAILRGVVEVDDLRPAIEAIEAEHQLDGVLAADDHRCGGELASAPTRSAATRWTRASLRSGVTRAARRPDQQRHGPTSDGRKSASSADRADAHRICDANLSGVMAAHPARPACCAAASIPHRERRERAGSHSAEQLGHSERWAQRQSWVGRVGRDPSR